MYLLNDTLITVCRPILSVHRAELTEAPASLPVAMAMALSILARAARLTDEVIDCLSLRRLNIVSHSMSLRHGFTVPGLGPVVGVPLRAAAAE